MLTRMSIIALLQESFDDIGGLETQIQELKEAIELPLTHPELYEEMGIVAPKGVILYGEPGTGASRCRSVFILATHEHIHLLRAGKTLLAKAVANSTKATFFRATGSELVQKSSGEGARLIRDLFKVAKEHAPSIIFLDEIDAIGRPKRSVGRHQRTLCRNQTVRHELPG
jgi:26S proteasome regulatory subunit T2